MDRLLIADDEKIVLDSLKYIINDRFQGMFQIFTAKSGREAIQCAEQHHIDIACMDISMPGINGLQTISRLRQVYPDIVFIVISAYDKFDYAAEAIRMGVMAYLLKPIKRDELVEALSDARRRVDQKRRQRQLELDTSEQMEKVGVMLERELVGSAISPNADRADLISHLRHFGLEYLSGYCLVLEFDDDFLRRNGVPHGQGEALGSDYYTVREQIKTVGRYFVGSLVSSFLVILRISPSEMERKALLDEAARIHQKLRDYAKAEVNIGAGNWFSSLDAATVSHNEAILDLRLRSGRRSGKDSAHSHIKAYNQGDSPVKEHNQGDTSRKGSPVQLAIAYIDNHFAENLTLDGMAVRVNMSPNYFSKLFREESGCNFIDYLTHVRINHAKYLLRQRKCSVKEVCAAVGYRDPGYFTRIFKKMVGVTPTEYN